MTDVEFLRGLAADMETSLRDAAEATRNGDHSYARTIAPDAHELRAATIRLRDIADQLEREGHIP